MPNWAGSDWYYLAYCLFEDINKPLPGKENIFVKNKEILSEWMPVDVYIGGDEHNTLHLLYSRFIYQFLHDLGVMPAHIREPYDKRVSHGVILGPDGFRMSKSRGNVVVPESVADKYGVDVLRLYLMFMGPFESVMAWNEKTLIGVKRFLDRLTIFVEKQKDSKESSERSLRLLNKTIEGVTQDLENFSFNTVVAKLMEAINKIDKLSREDLKKLIKLIAPLAPYTAEELWHKLGEKESVHGSDWPEYDQKVDDNEMIKVPVAVNGKVRDQLEVDQEESQNASKMISRALELDKIKTWVEGKEIIKEIYVPGKMLNLVVR
jgi:leucyl-tRNA synthetase